MRCLTWNLEWARPGSKRTGLILEIIREIDPDVVCFTEVVTGMIPDGHVIEAGTDYGYSHAGDRRKVVLWSKTPWSETDSVGCDSLPLDRFVSGSTAGIRFVGVCIPWKDAHVTTGRKDRARWEDHLAYCNGLKGIVERVRRYAQAVCLIGDFNQCIPRVKQPASVAKVLADVFPTDFTICTAGILDAERKPLIDHIAVSPGLVASELRVVGNTAPDGTRLSDHVGIAGRLERSAER